MRYLGAALLSFIVIAPVHADQSFDACIRKLCRSTDQMDCWVKAGAAMCDKDQISCKNVPDHTGARVVNKRAARWQIETKYGKGWISDRMIMVNGGKC